MSLDLSNTLVVGISATALFDLRTEDAEFQAEYAKNPENAVSEYRKLMEEKEDKELFAGTGFPLVRALLKLNRYQNKGQPLLAIIVMTKDNMNRLSKWDRPSFSILTATLNWFAFYCLARSEKS